MLVGLVEWMPIFAMKLEKLETRLRQAVSGFPKVERCETRSSLKAPSKSNKAATQFP